MKAVILSLRPQWCEKIFNGSKSIEVRKTCPKLEPPFEVLVYCTMPKERWSVGHQIFYNDTLYTLPTGELKIGDALELMADWMRKYNEDNFLNGKVIGSFVCDRIVDIQSNGDDCGNYWHEWDDECGIEAMCLSYEELETYLGKSVGYGWHITEPKLFDKPRELCEFYAPCRKGKETADESCKGCSYAFKGVSTGEIICDNAITRPPQSFCYIEVDE